MEFNTKQLAKIKEIAKKYHLKLILLFGSHVTGRIHKESDIDVAYLPEKFLDFDKEALLNYEFTNIFHSDKVDTVNLKKSQPLLFYSIFQNPLIIYKEDELIFPTYRAYAFKKYVETKPLYEARLKKLDKELKKI